MRTPYTQQVNAAIERALTSSTTLTVGYLQNRGKRLFAIRDVNLGPLSPQSYNFTILDGNYNPTGQVYSTQIYTSRIDSRYGNINQVENGGKQWYDALVVQVNKRFSHMFSGTISYTWAHELDENQMSGNTSAATVFFSGGPQTLFNGNYAADKGNGNTDQRHKFVGTFVAHPRFTKSNSAMARTFVNGWEMTGLLTLAASRPAFESVTWSSTTALPQVNTGTINGSGGDTRIPWLPVNPLRIDPIYRYDTRISKMFALHEKMTLSLLFEVFNLTNSQTNTSVQSQGYRAANKGTLTAPNFVAAPCASATATVCAPTTPGAGTASAGFPDGTNARRAQVGVRFAF
jgi:hypothetical protein